MDIRIVDLHDTIMCQVPKQPSRYGCRHEALLEVPFVTRWASVLGWLMSLEFLESQPRVWLRVLPCFPEYE